MQNQDIKIGNSIESYKEALLKDINLTLKLIVGEKTYMTKLVEWFDKKLIIEAPLEKLDWILFQNETQAKMLFMAKKGVFSTHVRIVNHYRKNDILYYGVEILEPLEKHQQRQYFRLDTLLPVTYHVLPKEDNKPSESDSLPLHKGTSVNISMGGMCLVSKVQLQKGDRVVIQLEFMNASFELLGEVLFMGEKTTSTNYNHRIKFLIEDTLIKNKLHKLIFEKQRILLSQPTKPLK